MVVIDKPTIQGAPTIFHNWNKIMLKNKKILSGEKMKIEYPLPVKNITFRLKIIGGWVPNQPELILHCNGEGAYKGGGKISQSQIFTLFKHAIEIGFFEMESVYDGKGYTLDKKGMIQCHEQYIYDFPTYEVEIKIGNKKKKVTDRGWAPKRLKKFANMIERAYKPKK